MDREEDYEAVPGVEGARHGAESRTLAVGTAKAGVPDAVLHVDPGSPVEAAGQDRSSPDGGEADRALIGGIIGGVVVLILGLWQ